MDEKQKGLLERGRRFLKEQRPALEDEKDKRDNPKKQEKKRQRVRLQGYQRFESDEEG